MGILKEQSIRLLRDDWNSLGVQAAMEEVYAVFNSDAPINIDSPVTISPQGNPQVPPLTITNNNEFPTSFVINNPEFPPFPQFPQITDDLNNNQIGRNIDLGDMLLGGTTFKNVFQELPPVTSGTKLDQVVVPNSPLGLGNYSRFGDNITINSRGDPDLLGTGTGLGVAIAGTIIGISGDTITVDTAFGQITVEKPPALKTSAGGADGVSYSPTGAQSRTASKNDFTEDQITVPPYHVGDLVYIMQVNTGGCIDLNVDARSWAAKIPGDE